MHDPRTRILVAHELCHLTGNLAWRHADATRSFTMPRQASLFRSFPPRQRAHSCTVNVPFVVLASSEAVPVVGYGAPTALVAENRELSFQEIDVVVLNRGAGRLSPIERAGVPVAPTSHLL